MEATGYKYDDKGQTAAIIDVPHLGATAHVVVPVARRDFAVAGIVPVYVEFKGSIIYLEDGAFDVDGKEVFGGYSTDPQALVVFRRLMTVVNDHTELINKGKIQTPTPEEAAAELESGVDIYGGEWGVPTAKGIALNVGEVIGVDR